LTKHIKNEVVMLKKSFFLVLMTGLFLFIGLGYVAMSADQGTAGASVLPPAAQNCGWTNMHFAEFLGQKYGINLGADEKNMSADDKYKALANALSQKGINYFLTAKPTDPLTCCGSASALYAVAGGKGASDSCDMKIDYLIKNNILKAGMDPCKVLCNPDQAFGAVAEEFHRPINPPNTNPPGETHERDSSRI